MTSKFSSTPLFQQVRDALAERIASGDWKAATQIPNETDLARELGVSPGTMRKALDLLASEGLVIRRQGRGTFVNDPASPELATRFDRLHGPSGERVIGRIDVIGATEGLATKTERERLRLAEGELVYRIRRVSSHLGKRFCLEEAVSPAALFAGLLESARSSVGIVAIAHAYGVLLGGAVEDVSVGTASKSVAEKLGIAEDASVLILDRVIKTRDGRPAEWRRAVCTMADMHYKVET